MRAFIAVSLPSALKARLTQIQNDLKGCNIACKWVNPENIHITLKFLGEIKDERLESIKKIISTVGAKFKSLQVTFNNFGFFPNPKRPRVLFIGTSKEEELRTISGVLEDKLETIGFKKEFKFRSHLTLARIKDSKNIDCLINKLNTIKLEEEFTASAITLYKSTLTKSGPIYEVIFKSNLTA